MVSHELEAHLPHLSRDKAGSLAIDEHSCQRLLEAFGAPLLVFSERRVFDNVTAIRSAFESHFDSVQVFYALKSCYLRPVVKSALEAGAGLEVMSGMELEIAAHHGCSGASVVCHGLGRDRLYTDEGVSLRGAMHVLDTVEDFDQMVASAREIDRRLRVAVRLAPDSSQWPSAVDPDSKFGMTSSDGQLDAFVERCLSEPQVDLVGVHTHVFTQLAKPEYWRPFVEHAATEIQRLHRRFGLRFEVINLGGGFAPRCHMEALGGSMDEFAKIAKDALKRVPYDFTLCVEPGRYITADAAIGITSIKASKARAGFSWKIVDISTNTLVPVPGAEYPLIPLNHTLGHSEIAGVSDGTCAPAVLSSVSEVEQVPVGSGAALLCCGAYTTVFAHIWGPLPSVIISVGSDGSVTTVQSVGDLERIFHVATGYKVDLGGGRVSLQ